MRRWDAAGGWHVIIHAKELIDRLGCGAAIVARMDTDTATRVTGRCGSAILRRGSHDPHADARAGARGSPNA